MESGPEFSMSLRAAEPNDAGLLLEWQQHADTRRYARNPAVPSEAEHLAWYAKKLASADCQFLIAEADGVPVGLLRLDRLDNEWELSVVVAPEARHRGVATKMLELLDSLQGNRRLVAEVLPGNDTSHRLFQAAGWRRDSERCYRKP